MAALEGERSALQMKIEEFQSKNQRERNELELASKELKRSTKLFEDGRKTWEREKQSEIQYIEIRKQELEVLYYIWKWLNIYMTKLKLDVTFLFSI